MPEMIPHYSLFTRHEVFVVLPYPSSHFKKTSVPWSHYDSAACNTERKEHYKLFTEWKCDWVNQCSCSLRGCDGFLLFNINWFNEKGRLMLVIKVNVTWLNRTGLGLGLELLVCQRWLSSFTAPISPCCWCSGSWWCSRSSLGWLVGCDIFVLLNILASIYFHKCVYGVVSSEEEELHLLK